MVHFEISLISMVAGSTSSPMQDGVHSLWPPRHNVLQFSMAKLIESGEIGFPMRPSGPLWILKSRLTLVPLGTHLAIMSQLLWYRVNCAVCCTRYSVPLCATGGDKQLVLCLAPSNFENDICFSNNFCFSWRRKHPCFIRQPLWKENERKRIGPARGPID